MYIRCAIFSYFNDLWYFLTVWYICKCSRVCTHLKKPKQERYTIASTKNSIGAKCNFSILLIGNSCIADIFLLHSCTRGAPHCKSDCTRQPLYQAPKCISLFVIYTRALSCDKWHNQRAPWSRRTLQTHFPAPTHTYTRLNEQHILGSLCNLCWSRNFSAARGCKKQQSCMWEWQLHGSGCVLYFLTLTHPFQL